jgi:hypothetical protein
MMRERAEADYGRPKLRTLGGRPMSAGKDASGWAAP